MALDNLTHEYTTFTKMYPETITSNISIISAFSIKVYFFLQVIFSLFGLGYMVLYLLSFNKPVPVYKPVNKADKLLYYYLLFTIFILVFIGRFFLPLRYDQFNDIVIISIMSSAMLTVLLASAVIFVKNRITT